MDCILPVAHNPPAPITSPHIVAVFCTRTFLNWDKMFIYSSMGFAGQNNVAWTTNCPVLYVLRGNECSLIIYKLKAHCVNMREKIMP